MTRTSPYAEDHRPSATDMAKAPAGGQARSLLVERLRTCIARIEAQPPSLAAPDKHQACASGPCWRLGVAEIDRHLPPAGLATAGVHEIAPETHGDMPAALGFAAALAVLRLQSLGDERPVLWCRFSGEAQEWGGLYGHGLEGLGLARDRLVTATLNKPQAVLWAVEEALKAGCLAAVIADAGRGIDLMATRRLMLAASQGATPGLLVFPAPPQGGTAARSRWTVAARPSLPPALDGDAPGAPAWNVGLTRCRGGRPGQWSVEWSHASHRFCLVAALCDRAADPRHAAVRQAAGGSAAGAGRGRLQGLAPRRG